MQQNVEQYNHTKNGRNRKAIRVGLKIKSNYEKISGLFI